MTASRQTSQTQRYFKSRWILPGEGPALENQILAISAAEIVQIYSEEEFAKLPKPNNLQLENLGQSIICPGLINMHTHLDYSALRHLDNYSPFFSWIQQLVANSWQFSSEQWFESALAGAAEIIQSGSSFILDSSYSGAAARAISHTGLRGIVGLEIFGIIEDEAEQNFSAWLAKYEKFLAEADYETKTALAEGRLKLTIAPHTPYSVSPALIEKALSWCKQKNLPMLIHVSESEAECRWIAAEDDKLEQFLQSAFRRELPQLDWRGHGRSPVEHLEHYQLLNDNVVAAHVVQVSQSDIAVLAKHAVSAVHCPRSNSRLRNGIAPLQDLIKSGINFGLGTDSAASTDDLNILNEVRFAWNLHRAVDKEFSETAEKALYYLTLGAAKAVKMGDIIGSIEAGKKADFAIFSIEHLPEIARQRPFESLIFGGAHCKSLYVDGKEIVTPGYISSGRQMAEI